MPSRALKWLRTPTGIGVAAAVLVGLALRLFVLTHALGVLDADEATTGLVARHFLHNHEHPVFYWSSNYGGTLEALVTAPFFVLFGATVATLKAVAVLWYAAGCVLAWRVGARLVSPRVGAAAGLLMWLWPGTYLWWSTKSRGFYGSLLVLGLVVALCALRLAERPDRVADWLVLGLAAGLGWWDGPQIAVLGVVAVAWLAARNPKALLRAPLAIPTALVGAAPWLLWNLRHHFDSFRIPPQPANATYAQRLARFWTEGVPLAAGLRVPYFLRWIEPWAPVAYVVVGLAAAVALIVKHRTTGLLLVGGLALYGVAYAFNPLTAHSADGRYVLLASPIIAIGLMAALPERRAVLAAALAAAVALTAGSLSSMPLGNSFFASDKPVPIHLGPLVRSLHAMHRTNVVADYGIAYRIDFEDGERINAAGAPYNRYQPYIDRLRSGPPPAWVFVSGSTASAHCKAALDQRHEPYRLARAGGFDVYLPDHRFLPGELPAF
jgi:4-amino-4-deoxy-L-arabinose transferase-like glycosyltransferase